LKRPLVVLAVLAFASALVWLAARRSGPPDVSFARVTRGRIESTLITNGRVEPIEWAGVRAEGSGAVETLHVREGQSVRKGDPLVTLESSAARAELASAQSRIAKAQAELSVIDRGGRAAEQTEIQRALAAARLQEAAEQKELESLERLLQKQAVTAYEVTIARQKLEQTRTEIRGLEQKKAALTDPADRAAAEAVIKEAEAAASLARRQIEQSIVRSPMDGVVYHLEARRGAYLRPGDLVANVGRLNELRVTVLVDEPELGRVQPGMPVTITWDALPGRKWTGKVDRIPTQVVAVGTRQVGEVIAIITNSENALIPGTNINAEIQSRVVDDALSIPKEAIRRRDGEVGVYMLRADALEWRPVELGVSSITRSQVVRGLSEGDAVALPTDRELHHGMKVHPVFR